ncbi:WD40/YVTN/BNR-like repeat-containing protein [Haloglomus litoreum]|uniref:WD40/YVTN/BNR-like repeat-containing protein n=1 Tax=Haloglomus litoreum TaxID=3034026 RepID=UPI0023E85825|nr:hypothetical protein [Haloglomus sp. DT116]
MLSLLALEDGLRAIPPDAGVATGYLPGHRVECLAGTGGAVLAGTFDDGLWRAADLEAGDGATDPSFERVAPETLPGRVTALATAPSDPDVVYLGAEPSEVYRSDDAGETWRECAPLTDLPSAAEWSFPPRPDTHHVRTLAVHPEDPERLYVGIEAGAFVRSADGGASWTERPPGSRYDNHALATHPDAPDRVYAAAGDGYAQSADAGASWDHPTAGLEHGYVWGLAVDPGDPDRVYVSAAHGAYAAHRVASADAHVYRRDGEGNWRRFDGETLGAGVPVGEGVCRAVLAAPAPDELLVCTNRGLFRSTDAGASFEQVAGGEWGVPRALVCL